MDFQFIDIGQEVDGRNEFAGLQRAVHRQGLDEQFAASVEYLVDVDVDRVDRLCRDDEQCDGHARQRTHVLVHFFDGRLQRVGVIEILVRQL